MEKPAGIRTKGSLNETQGRNETATGPSWISVRVRKQSNVE